MTEHFEIVTPSKVPCFSQLIGKYKPYVSCFPTSNAMCIKHCLNILNLKKDAIGCKDDIFLEDYVNMLLEEPETLKWIKNNGVKYNSWWLNYLPKKNQRQIHAVEAYIFNTLMNKLGFKAEATTLNYDSYCSTLEENNLPIIISGDFSSTTGGKVSGHMNVGVGYNSLGVQEILCNDPYGNALKGYPVDSNVDNMRAEYIRYSKKFFVHKDGSIYGMVISKI